jgi:hypothetical protein
MDRAKTMGRIAGFPVSLISFLLVAILILAFTSCERNAQEADANQTFEDEEAASWWTPDSEPIAGGDPLEIPEPEEDIRGAEVLSVTGEGVAKWLSLTLEDLKELSQGPSPAAIDDRGALYLEQEFSILDNWPSKKFIKAKGIDISDILEMAELDERASMFTIEMVGGYYIQLTRDQILDKRFFFPNILKGSTYGSKRVKPMVAWETSEENQSPKDEEDEILRLLIGQKGLFDANGILSIDGIRGIRVSFREAEKWPEPSVDIEDGRLVFYHENMDQIKLHYTLDGRKPDQNSPVYNPSATFLQPELIEPIAVSGSGRVKVKAVGYGKEDSQVVEFRY